MKRIYYAYIDTYKGLSTPTWMLAIVMLINRTGAMVLPFLGIYMTNVLDFSLKEAGYVLSCFGVGSVAGSLTGGWLTDKWGHFRVQTGSLFLAVPVFISLPYLKHLETLAVGVFLLSLITEIFRPANSVSISTYAKPENITRAYSLNRMALNLGFSIGPALGGFLAAISYHLLFYGNAISSTIAGIVFYIYFNRVHKRYAIGKATTSDEKNKNLKNISPWRDTPFVLFTGLCSLYSICFFQFLNTLPLFYKEVGNLSSADIGMLLGFNGLVVFCLEMFLVGSSEKRFSVSTILVVGTILGAISFLLLAFGTNLGLFYFSMFLLSVSEILTLPFIATIAIKRAPSGKSGVYMGMNALAFSSAHILSPLLGTYVAAHFGFKTLWVATAIIGIMTAWGYGVVVKKLG